MALDSLGSETAQTQKRVAKAPRMRWAARTNGKRGKRVGCRNGISRHFGQEAPARRSRRTCSLVSQDLAKITTLPTSCWKIRTTPGILTFNRSFWP